MKTFILISCVSKKVDFETSAEDLYISPLFKYNLAYAKGLNPEKIFILSAKYGLLELDSQIKPYNQTLNQMDINQRKIWAKNVLEKLENKINLKEDKIIFLAGKRYREFLVPHITNFWLFNSNILGAVIGCYLGLKYAPQIDKFFYVERRGRKKPGKTRLKRLK